MPEELPITPGLALPLDEVEIRTSRSSGPGGQHANVTASRVTATFRPLSSAALTPEQRHRIATRLGPVVTASAQDNRSQLRNRELALERLAARLRDALHVQRHRTPTKPTKGSKKRRVDAKKRRGDIKRGRRPPPDD